MAMSARDYLQAEMDRLAEQAKAIPKQAQDEGRSVTAEEREQVQAILSQHQSKRKEVQDMDDNEELQASIDRLHKPQNLGGSDETPQEGTSLGEAFVNSAPYKALMAQGTVGDWTTGPVDLPNIWGATVTHAASPVTSPDVRPGIQALPIRRLTVRDLIAPGSTENTSVTVTQEASETNAAAETAETVTKPESTIVLALVNEPVRKIATFLPVADEMLEDVAALRSFLDARLRLFVQHREEASLIAGDGTAPNISGFLDRVGIQTGTRSALAVTGGEVALSTTIPAAVFMAMTNIRTIANTEPDGIIMHPTNWAAVRLTKDSNGQFFGGGPFTGAYGNAGGMAPDTLWGLPVVVTSAMTLNTALVGAFGTQSQIFDKSGLVVEASNSHGTFFKENITAFRAEERLALACYRPNAFHAITALQTA